MYIYVFIYVSVNKSKQIYVDMYVYWLVVSTTLKNISQLGLLSPIYGKQKMFQTNNQYTSKN